MRLIPSLALAAPLLVLPAGAQDPVAETLELRASGSTLEFTPRSLSAKAGSRVRIRFINDGTFPHNVVIPRSIDDIDMIATAAYSAGETGYVPMEEKAKLLAFSTLASPGQTVEFILTMPAAGEYQYVCMYPGHANLMFGTLRSRD
jgi:plastocyanin